MNEIRATVDSDPSRAIAALSHELHLPKERVLEIYRMEFDRLATRARIPTFLVVLAMRNTRSILRGGGKSEWRLRPTAAA
jgi:hypothetical protein